MQSAQMVRAQQSSLLSDKGFSEDEDMRGMWLLALLDRRVAQVQHAVMSAPGAGAGGCE